MKLTYEIEADSPDNALIFESIALAQFLFFLAGSLISR
jgi:hypothetical protein